MEDDNDESLECKPEERLLGGGGGGCAGGGGITRGGSACSRRSRTPGIVNFDCNGAVGIEGICTDGI